MSVFREITIKWKGEDYTLVPSLRLMRSIEMGDISFTDIAVRTSQGRPPVSHIAFVLSKMLAAAGVKATEDEVFEQLVIGKPDEITNLIGLVLTAFAPVETDAKNRAAQTAPQSTARAETEEQAN